MKASALVALCLGLLLLGLAGIFFIISFFFKKSKQEDDAIRQWQQHMMLRIDEAFPSLERLLQEGAAIPAPAADSEKSAEALATLQDDADAAMQREIEESNASEAAQRSESGAGSAPFRDGGGFVR